MSFETSGLVWRTAGGGREVRRRRRGLDEWGFGSDIARVCSSCCGVL